MVSITKEKYERLNSSDKAKYVQEWNCKCSECGKTWHYLADVEEKMRKQVSLNACLQMSNCCNPCVGAMTSNANTQLSKQIEELKQCPNCQSRNVKREARYFRKQE